MVKFLVGAFVGLALTRFLNVNVFWQFWELWLPVALGIVVERIAYRPLRRSSRLSALIMPLSIHLCLPCPAQGAPDYKLPC